VSPRELRKRLESGDLTFSGRVPAPPIEWGDVRKAQLRAATHAAFLFLIERRNWDEIRQMLQLRHGRDGGMTRQRVYQYVIRGIEFMQQRGSIR
jgi:hypothetical protein